MALIPVHFEYLTGLRRVYFHAARLSGNWSDRGFVSDQWTTVPMQPFTAADGCPAFRASVELDDSQIGQEFQWSIFVDSQQQSDVCGIPTEVNDPASRERYRTFSLQQAGQSERYYLTHCCRLGANKLFIEGQAEPAIRFAVWAPNARNVELVCGAVSGDRPEALRGGYISNNGEGIAAVIPMHREEDGVWATRVDDDPTLRHFADFDYALYMFRITKDDGSIAYRTDLYSRCQIGNGDTNPEMAPWSGLCRDLDGSKSCSLVIDPERVTELFRDEVWPESRWMSADDFWQSEFYPDRPVPNRVEDLVMYELHVEALGADRGVTFGTLEDAMRLLDYVVDLGVNAVLTTRVFDLLAESRWYPITVHAMTMENAEGTRNQFKHFVRECHRRGIAVILEVDYSHLAPDAERKEWAYDSNAPERNIYYWYEGRASDYPDPTGGYIMNGSSGWGPRFWEEMVRKMLISSAATLVSEFHFDGFWVDLTQAIHHDNVRRADGNPNNRANMFGQKFLREWSRTLKLVEGNVFLIAEDHSDWLAVTQPTDQGGLGFEAVVSADFHKHLVGGANAWGPDDAGLIAHVARSSGEPPAMELFADVLSTTTQNQIIFHESCATVRTMSVAVGGAPPKGESARVAEARCRFACGMTLLARGIPMFLMGAEVGSVHNYRLDTVCEDLFSARMNSSRMLFRFYQDIICLRLAHVALRSSNIEVLYVNNADRVLAFRRWERSENLIIISSLNNAPFALGYQIHHAGLPDAKWLEVFNSDWRGYGGSDLSNEDTVLSTNGSLIARVPANGFVVFQQQ